VRPQQSVITARPGGRRGPGLLSHHALDAGAGPETGARPVSRPEGPEDGGRSPPPTPGDPTPSGSPPESLRRAGRPFDRPAPTRTADGAGGDPPPLPPPPMRPPGDPRGV